jgi:hypothetical protein
MILIGVGGASCGRWLELRQNAAIHQAQRQWILGFVTGINWATSASDGPQAHPPDADAAATFVDAYCRNNPLHPLAMAASALVQVTGGPKALHEWRR